MRASMSAPGVFSPVNATGVCWWTVGSPERTDRCGAEMGVDILIVVDVGTPLLKRDKVSRAPVISNQMLAILSSPTRVPSSAKMTPRMC